MAEDEAVEQKQNGADTTHQAASGSSETPENGGSSGSEDAPVESKSASSGSSRRKKKKEPKERVYTLSEVSEQTGISMPTLQRYKKNYQSRIPSVGKGRRQRYPEAAFQVFEEIKQENIKRRGRPKKKKSGGSGGSGGRQRKSGGKRSNLLTLTAVSEQTGISYPTLVRYVKLHKDRIPFEGTGRKKRYHPEAVQVFQEIRSESPRGRRKKGAGAGGGGRPAGDSGLGRRVQALERSHASLEKQIKQLIKELKKPLKVTIGR